MSESAILDLVRRAGFIFAGTVTAPDQSSLRALPPQPGLAVVRFDRGFLVNPVLGKLDGRPITVRLVQGGAGTGTVRPGQQLVFFSTAWMHGEQIAVTELSHLAADPKVEQEVANAVAALPELHLRQRIATAVLIVHGTVTEIERAVDIPGTASEHDPAWMRALIDVREVLKGEANGPAGRGRSKRTVAALLFPGSGDIAFRNAPRPSKGQEAVFLLQQGSARLPKEALITPDPADIQPPGTLPTVRRMIAGPVTP